MGEISNRDPFFYKFVLSPTKLLKVSSNRFRTKRFATVQKRQQCSYPKGRDNVILAKKNAFLFFYTAKLSHYKTYVIRNSFFLILLNMFVDKIPSTGIKLIRFHLQGLIILDFRWNAWIIRTLHNYGPLDPELTCTKKLARWLQISCSAGKISRGCRQKSPQLPIACGFRR